MLAAEISDDDNVLVKKLVEKHKPEVTEYDVKQLLQLIEDVLRHSSISSEVATTASLAPADHVEDRSHLPDLTNMLEALSPKIDRISSEISYKSLDGVDAHYKTINIFDMLTMFQWDMKIVLALASLARSCGEFWLLAQIYTNQFAKSMAILKQLSSIMEYANSLKPRFNTLNDLVKNILDVTKCVIEFHDLPTQPIPAYTTTCNYIPVASYWAIRSIVACAAHISSLSTLGYQIITSSDAWELSTLISKLENVNNNLRQDIINLLQYYRIEQTIMISPGRESKMDDEDHPTHVILDLFSKPHVDNMEVLKALIYQGDDDLLPLYDGLTKKRVSLNELRKKNVLLLFSGIEISTTYLLILEQIYSESKAPRMEVRYELVWIPIVDPNTEWTDPKKNQFENLKENMSWYSVYNPSFIGKPVISFIQSEWKYKNKPILVPLDPQGKVSCLDATHMMWIWGNDAYPFTSSREEALWKNEAWRFELLIEGTDQEILNWTQNRKYIFLYGGDDPQWVRRFVQEARKVATATQIPLEMIYVGKSDKWEQVQKIIDNIIHENLDTQYWSNQSMIWFFWTRLQSMLFSKLQYNQTNDDDLMIKEIKKILIYDQQGGCIILAKGSKIVVSGNTTTGLQTLMEYSMWEENISKDGFEVAFKSHYDKIHSVAGPCFRMEFSQTIEQMRIPGPLLSCPECLSKMHVLTTFQCCHDEKLDEDFLATTLTLPSI